MQDFRFFAFSISEYYFCLPERLGEVGEVGKDANDAEDLGRVFVLEDLQRSKIKIWSVTVFWEIKDQLPINRSKIKCLPAEWQQRASCVRTRTAMNFRILSDVFHEELINLSVRFALIVSTLYIPKY